MYSIGNGGGTVYVHCGRGTHMHNKDNVGEKVCV